VRAAFYFYIESGENGDVKNSGRTSGKLRSDLERTPVGVWKKAGGSLPAIQE